MTSKPWWHSHKGIIVDDNTEIVKAIKLTYSVSASFLTVQDLLSVRMVVSSWLEPLLELKTYKSAK